MPPRKATTARKAAAKKAAPKKAAPKRNTTRKTAPKKTVAKKSSRATMPDVPTAGPGERVWLLDVPFRTPAPGAQFVKKWKSYAWVGTELPVELAPFKALPFSYQQWVEDDINDSTGERPVAAPKIPRPEQVSGAAAVVDAARAGKRGFLLADNAGLGKTLIAVMSAKTIAEERGETNILVLVDRPAQITIPHWRYSIASVGDGGFRWLIMSPDQLKKLIARNGRPKYTFGVVIADEAQLYSNDTQRTAAFEKVARFSNAHEQAPFVLSVTATPGHTPADQRYLAPLFAQLHSEPSEYWSDLGARLVESGLPLDKSYGKWTWSAEAKESPTLQSRALETVRGWMSNSKPPLMIHRPTPWGTCSARRYADRPHPCPARRVRDGVGRVRLRNGIGPQESQHRARPCAGSALPTESGHDPRRVDGPSGRRRRSRQASRCWWPSNSSPRQVIHWSR